MASFDLCFMRPSFAAIALSLLLSVCYSFSFSFTFLSLLLFFLLIFSNTKKLWQASMVEKQKPKPSDQLDGNENQAIQNDEDEDEGVLERLAIMHRPLPETEESDDESLIEITLPDGHYKAPEEEKQETILLQQMSEGLMELLSDIIEEDNLIEIDINMGSIKCSRPLEIKV